MIAPERSGDLHYVVAGSPATHQIHSLSRPKVIRAFIEDRTKAGKKPATIKRYAATIARVYVAAGLLIPCWREAVRLGLTQMGGRPP